MTVLGLTGFAQSGKSTVANYLVEQHGFTRLSFAAPLKQMLRTLNPIIAFEDSGDTRVDQVRVGDLFNGGWTEQDIKADTNLGPEYRRLLQVLGTDCVRAVQEDFWIRAAEAQITDPAANYVFDDCRFPNEAQFIESKSPLGLWNIRRGGVTAVNGHVSEQHAGNMGEFVTLFNDRTIEMLFENVDVVLDLVQGQEAQAA
jgi:hypothetical protein